MTLWAIHMRLFSHLAPNPHTAPPSRRERITWTLGTLLIVAGIYVLLYVGGLYAQIEYNRQAARGDSDLPAPRAVTTLSRPAPADAAEPDAFNVPVLSSEGAILSSVPDEAAAPVQGSTVERLVIPSIDVDSKVIEVGWQVQTQPDGSEVAVWQVAEYAVGHHQGSANPGEGDNVVLAGHVGGFGLVFRDLFYVQPGDRMMLYSEGRQYLYVVEERLVLDEVGVPPEQRAANARYIEPTDSEYVTLVTCWPASGPDRFSQRVIVRAIPYATTLDTVQAQNPGTWTVR